jgi:hypothetical protein
MRWGREEEGKEDEGGQGSVAERKEGGARGREEGGERRKKRFRVSNTTTASRGGRGGREE